MTKKPLHIISFDNPFPPVYGGIIEVFYKLKPLHDLGFSIHFHCYTDRVPVDYSQLASVTEKVYFYKIEKRPRYLLSKLPFSVRSRSNPRLLENLNAIDAPILFEGLKTSYLVGHELLPNHLKILRLHNIEHRYFEGIANSETNLFKKQLFALEAAKFKRYEMVIEKFDRVVALSNYENEYVNERFANSDYVPVFHGNTTVMKLNGFGKYAIYHGDLRMSDNKRVVKQLIQIFKSIPDFDLVIASSSGRSFTETLISEASNIRFEQIRNFEHLKQLLSAAHINLVFSFQRSGTKLKLMNSLYNSRFCLINGNIMDDTRIMKLCEIAESEAEIKAKIQALRKREFDDYERRRAVLETVFSDSDNAKLLANLINKS